MSLDRLFEMAESNSVHLRQSFMAEEEARRGVSEARNGRLPDINSTLSLSYIGDGFTTKRNLSDYQKAPIPHFGSGFSLSIDQPVYTGGAVSASIGMAELESTAARYATEMRRDNIRFQLAGNYLDIYKCHNLRSVVENNAAQAVKVLEEMKARYEQGVALQNDITRYELLVANLDLQLVKIENTLKILNQQIAMAVGLPDGTEVVPDSAILSRSLPCGDEAYWIGEAEANSPSLRMGQVQIDMCRTAESLAKAERLPKVGLKAGWSIDGPILVEVPPINRNLSYWYVGVGLSYNLSSLYKTNKSLARRRAATHSAVERLNATMEDVTLAVQTDYVHYLEAYQELVTQLKSVELAEKNYKVVSTRYSSEMALITDLLDASNSKLDAERRLVDAKINIIYYYYKLLFSTGKI